MFYLVIINGLIDSFNPCAIGVLLAYLALLLSLKVERKNFLNVSFFYILATFTTYLLIGLGILKVMHLFGVHNFFGWLAAAVILILGLFNLKEFFWPNWQVPVLSNFFNRCHLPKWRPEATIISAVTLGFLIGICEFPCSGGIYLVTVSLLSLKATFWQGVGYLLLYNLMFVMPLVIIFLIVGNQKIFGQLHTWSSRIFVWSKLIMGLAMTVSSILLLIWLIQSVQ